MSNTQTKSTARKSSKPVKVAAADTVPQKGKGRTAKVVATDTETVASPKCATARTQRAKPQAKMLRVISVKGKHPGKALRIKRWDSYSKGMSLQECKETDGLDHLDVLFYVEHGMMELRPATDKEVEAAVTAWQATNQKEAA